MIRSFFKSLLLLSFTLVICCILYPLVLWAIGQTAFPSQANGSLLKGPDGRVVGSRLIAQPFTGDEYFHPRPSGPSYDASASASSSLAPSNYALRDRVARMLGPIVRYKDGSKAGQLVAPDVENWFGKDFYQGKPRIVAQWADLHNSLAQAWANAPTETGAYVDEWAQSHPAIVARWLEDNPGSPQPKAADLAVAFFESFSKENPGKFPSVVRQIGSAGKEVVTVEAVSTGTDVQSIFFDMWRQDHPDAELEDLPGDLVMTSGSGLDPHITLENAKYQLDRVASKWAVELEREPDAVRTEIERVLQENAAAPWGGLTGEKIINVLEVNLELCRMYGVPITAR